MKKVLLLLIDGFETFEASVFIDVLGWNLFVGDKSTQLFSCGLSHQVKTAFNQKVITDFKIDQIDVNDFDALAIPGGFEEFGFYKNAYKDEVRSLIKNFHHQKKLIASICTGAFPIAKSGILTNKNGTTYNLNPVRQETLKNMGVNILNQPIVEDSNIITSWNPSTALDVSFLLLEKLTNKENANFIKSQMGLV